LLKHLNSYKAKSNQGASFCGCLIEQIESRFGPNNLPDVVWMAALLTPCLRDSPALIGHRENAWKLLKARFSETTLLTTTQQRTDEEIQVDKADTSLNALRIRYSKKDMGSNSQDDDYSEFKRFKALPGCDAPTLDWWRANNILFPRVAIIARRILAIVGSSAPVEHLFSTVGNVYTNKRQQLKASTACCQVLLHENKHL